MLTKHFFRSQTEVQTWEDVAAGFMLASREKIPLAIKNTGVCICYTFDSSEQTFIWCSLSLFRSTITKEEVVFPLEMDCLSH